MKGKTYKRGKKKSSYVTKGTGTKIIHTGEGSVVKKRKIRGQPKISIEKQTNKLITKANARLNSLERGYKIGTWASKQLKEKLTMNQLKQFTKSNRVKRDISKLNETELIAVNKALRTFLNSKTSTKKGIKEVREKQIERIKERLQLSDEKAEEVTTEEAEFFYNMYGDKDFDTLAEKIGASALEACIDDAIDANDSENEFLQRLEWYSSHDMQDEELRKIAIRVYNKYVLNR